MNANGLTQQQVERQDIVDNTILSLIRVINPSNKEIEWDIEMIGEIRDVLKKWLVDKVSLTTEQEFYPYLEE
jgi:DNA polymerase sigma